VSSYQNQKQCRLLTTNKHCGTAITACWSGSLTNCRQWSVGRRLREGKGTTWCLMFTSRDWKRFLRRSAAGMRQMVL